MMGEKAFCRLLFGSLFVFHVVFCALLVWRTCNGDLSAMIGVPVCGAYAVLFAWIGLNLEFEDDDSFALAKLEHGERDAN